MVKKVKAMVSEIEQRINPVEQVVVEEVKVKKERKPRSKKLSIEEFKELNKPMIIEAVKEVKVETKAKRQLSPLQLAYNKYKSEQWLQYKAKGTSFKNMLQDEKFKSGWTKLKNKM